MKNSQLQSSSPGNVDEELEKLSRIAANGQTRTPENTRWVFALLYHHRSSIPPKRKEYLWGSLSLLLAAFLLLSIVLFGCTPY